MNSDINLLESQTAVDNAPTETSTSTLADASLPTPPTTMKEANLKACSSEGDMVSLNPYWLLGLDEKVRAQYFPGLTEFNGKVALINDNNAGDSKIDAKYYCYPHDMGGVLKRHTNVVHIQQNDAAEDGFYHTMYFNDDSTSSGPASPAITTTSDTIINENLQITTKNYFPTQMIITEHVVNEGTTNIYNTSFQGVPENGGEDDVYFLPPVLLCKNPPQDIYYFKVDNVREKRGSWPKPFLDDNRMQVAASLRVYFQIYGNLKSSATDELLTTFASQFKTQADYDRGNSFTFTPEFFSKITLNIKENYNYVYIKQGIILKTTSDRQYTLYPADAYSCDHIEEMNISLYRETVHAPQTLTTYTYTTNPLNYADEVIGGVYYRSVANDMTAFNIETKVSDTSLKKLLTAGRIISNDTVVNALQIRRNSIQDAELKWNRTNRVNYITLNFTCRDNWYDDRLLAIHMAKSSKSPAVGTIYITAPTAVFDSTTNTYKYSINTVWSNDESPTIHMQLKEFNTRCFWIQPVDDTSMIKLPTVKFSESKFLIS